MNLTKTMTKERLEQIYTEYIGNGQFGIDFEKKHILEAMKACETEGIQSECVHPFHAVMTRCMGEINYCTKCGKDL